MRLNSNEGILLARYVIINVILMLISNVHKSIIVMNSFDTRFSRNVFEAIQKTRSTCVIGSKTTRLCPVVLNITTNQGTVRREGWEIGEKWWNIGLYPPTADETPVYRNKLHTIPHSPKPFMCFPFSPFILSLLSYLVKEASSCCFRFLAVKDDKLVVFTWRYR